MRQSSCLRAVDPLVIHDVPELTSSNPDDFKGPKKCPELLHGLSAVQDCVFYPSRLSFNWCSRGNLQTVMTAYREWKYNSSFKYDKREAFTLRDGGTIHIDFKGNGFKNQPTSSEDGSRPAPLVFLVNGLTQQSGEPTIKLVVEHLNNEGMEVAVINYRGLADAKITSPRLFCADSWEDILEPMKYMYSQYVEKTERKVFAIGFSMGANILANVLGYIGDGKEHKIKIDGACVIQAPHRMWIACRALFTSMGGFYNRRLGKNIKAVMLNHESELNEAFK